MATLTSTRPADVIDSQKYCDAGKVLTDFCDQKLVGRFELIHSGYSTSATLTNLYPQGLELRVHTEDKSEPLLLSSICLITFASGATIYAVLGHLIDVRQPKNGERRVVVSIPRQLMTTNLRQSFRVPVIKESGLQTIVRLGDQRQFQASACDIAEAGIEIEFKLGDHPELSVGTVLELELHFRDEVYTRKGEVRRVVGRRCGVLFHEKIENGKLDTRINSLVLALRQLWLKNRIK